MKELELDKTETIIIPSIEPWYGTGILLKSNCTYQFDVVPPNQVWYDGHILDPFTADGRKVPWLLLLYPFIRMPSVKWFALLGCIDRNRNTYFKIGTSLKNYSPPIDGELICFANDALGFYKHNNEGNISINVSRIK